MVTNAEANIWAEELCAKMCDVLPTVDNQVWVDPRLTWIKDEYVFCIRVLTFPLLNFLHVLTFSSCFVCIMFINRLSSTNNT